jgi:hypothetical protein
VQGTCDFLEKKGIPCSKEEGFDHFDVGRTQGYEILKKPSARLVHHNPRSESHRKVAKEHIERIEE